MKGKEPRFPLVTELIIREASGINERRRRWEQKGKGKGKIENVKG